MSLLSDIQETFEQIEKIPNNFKLVFGPVLLISPIWYIALYLFPTNFINQHPFYLALCCTYALSLISHFWMVVFLLTAFEHLNSKKETLNLNVIPALLNSMVLIGNMVAGYTNHWSFYEFFKHICSLYFLMFLVAGGFSFLFTILFAFFKRKGFNDAFFLSKGLEMGINKNGKYFRANEQIILPAKTAISFTWQGHDNVFYEWETFIKYYKDKAGEDFPLK